MVVSAAAAAVPAVAFVLLLMCAPGVLAQGATSASPAATSSGGGGGVENLTTVAPPVQPECPVDASIGTSAGLILAVCSSFVAVVSGGFSPAALAHVQASLVAIDAASVPQQRMGFRDERCLNATASTSLAELHEYTLRHELRNAQRMALAAPVFPTLPPLVGQLIFSFGLFILAVGGSYVAAASYLIHLHIPPMSAEARVQARERLEAETEEDRERRSIELAFKKDMKKMERTAEREMLEIKRRQLTSQGKRRMARMARRAQAASGVQLPEAAPAALTAMLARMQSPSTKDGHKDDASSHSGGDEDDDDAAPAAAPKAAESVLSVPSMRAPNPSGRTSAIPSAVSGPAPSRVTTTAAGTGNDDRGGSAWVKDRLAPSVIGRQPPPPSEAPSTVGPAPPPPTPAEPAEQPEPQTKVPVQSTVVLMRTSTGQLVPVASVTGNPSELQARLQQHANGGAAAVAAQHQLPQPAADASSVSSGSTATRQKKARAKAQFAESDDESGGAEGKTKKKNKRKEMRRRKIIVNAAGDEESMTASDASDDDALVDDFFDFEQWLDDIDRRVRVFLVSRDLRAEARRMAVRPSVVVAAVDALTMGLLYTAMRTAFGYSDERDWHPVVFFIAVAVILLLGVVPPVARCVWLRHWNSDAWEPAALTFLDQRPLLRRLVLPVGFWSSRPELILPLGGAQPKSFDPKLLIQTPDSLFAWWGCVLATWRGADRRPIVARKAFPPPKRRQKKKTTKTTNPVGASQRSSSSDDGSTGATSDHHQHGSDNTNGRGDTPPRRPDDDDDDDGAKALEEAQELLLLAPGPGGGRGGVEAGGRLVAAPSQAKRQRRHTGAGNAAPRGAVDDASDADSAFDSQGVPRLPAESDDGQEPPLWQRGVPFKWTLHPLLPLLDGLRNVIVCGIVAGADLYEPPCPPNPGEARPTTAAVAMLALLVHAVLLILLRPYQTTLVGTAGAVVEVTTAVAIGLSNYPCVRGMAVLLCGLGVAAGAAAVPFAGVCMMAHERLRREEYALRRVAERLRPPKPPLPPPPPPPPSSLTFDMLQQHDTALPPRGTVRHRERAPAALRRDAHVHRDDRLNPLDRAWRHHSPHRDPATTPQTQPVASGYMSPRGRTTTAPSEAAQTPAQQHAMRLTAANLQALEYNDL